MKTRLIAKAILLDKDNKVLAIRRSKTDTRRPLQWDFPGGMVEEGEDFAEATVREVQEETGLSVDPRHLDLVFTETVFAEGMNLIWMIFVGRAYGEITLSFEHDKSAWMELDEAIGAFEYPRQKEVLIYVKEKNLLPDLPL